MCRHIALSFALLCCSSLVRADATFEFSVDTSSVTGTSGSLDFQFNPGPLVSQAASLEILNLTTDGTFTAAPVLTGEVSGGPLPAPPVTFDNLAPFNDYFQGFTFDSISYLISGSLGRQSTRQTALQPREVRLPSACFRMRRGLCLY